MVGVREEVDYRDASQYLLAGHLQQRVFASRLKTCTHHFVPPGLASRDVGSRGSRAAGTWAVEGVEQGHGQ